MTTTVNSRWKTTKPTTIKHVSLLPSHTVYLMLVCIWGQGPGQGFKLRALPNVAPGAVGDSDGKGHPYPTCVVEVGCKQSLLDLHRAARVWINSQSRFIFWCQCTTCSCSWPNCCGFVLRVSWNMWFLVTQHIYCKTCFVGSFNNYSPQTNKVIKYGLRLI